MRVGDTAFVKEEIYNRNVRAPNQGTLMVEDSEDSLRTSSDCIKPAFADDRMKSTMQFPSVGRSSVVAWTLTALTPGECQLIFITTPQVMNSIDVGARFKVDIYDRFKPADEAVMVSGAAGGVGAIIAALIIANGAIFAARLANPGSPRINQSP
jgi:hypothetical protein